MGYTTDFNGQWVLNKPLDSDTHSLLDGLATTRRMARKGLDEKLYGVEGEFYVQGKDDDFFLPEDKRDKTILDYNTPPSTQPGLWCQWKPTADGKAIEWDGGEKFYNYIDWIDYLIIKVLAPRGYVLNGDVSWQGEDSDDRGIISIRNNVISTKLGRVVYAVPRKHKKAPTKLQRIAWIDKRISDLQKEKKKLTANG